MQRLRSSQCVHYGQSATQRSQPAATPQVQLAEQANSARRRSCRFAQSQKTCTEHPCRQRATCSQQGADPLNSSVVLGRTVVKRVRVVVQARQTLGVAGIANLREPQEHLAQVGVLCIQKSACLLRTQLQGQRRDASMTASAHRLSRERCAHHDVHHAARVGHVVVHLRGSGFSKGFS